MAYYLDLVNGNDASDGTTWAKAWKTVTSGATAARIAPGDVIRIAKSGDPVSIGNATWTNLSATVTLASALTTTVSNCDASFTAANSGTATTTTTRKQGTAAADITTAAATATATKYAYRDLGATLDLSSYDAITLWFQPVTSAIADANRYVIKLCSDTTGDTAVDEFSIPASGTSSVWIPLTLTRNGGGNLGNAIKSIGWYTGSSSPGNSNRVYIDNIEACSSTGLNLTALISKNSAASGGTDTWHGLQSISSTTVILGNRNSDGATATLMGYYTKGTSPETVTTYIRPTIKITPQSGTATASAIQDSGTAGNYITFTGGWNTSTDLQDGETWIDGQNGAGNGISQNSQSYIKINRWNVCRFNYGLAQAANTTALTNWLVENFIATNCTATAMTGYLSTSTVTATINNCNTAINDGGSGNSTFKSTATYKILNNLSADGMGNSQDFYYPSIERYNCSGTGLTIAPAYVDYYEQDRAGGIIKNIVAGVYRQYGQLFIKELKLSNSSQAALTGDTIVINKATVSAMTSLGGVPQLQIKQLNGATTQLIGSDFAGGSGLNANVDLQPSAFFNNVNNVATDNRAYWKYGNALSQTTTRHTASGVAWQINITSVEQTSTYPCYYPITKFAVNASSLVTVKAWVKLSHATNIGAKLAILANEIAGVSADVTATKAADTNWEELTITFTPTVAGVVQIYVLAYWLASTANQSVYVDDVTISQA